MNFSLIALLAAVVVSGVRIANNNNNDDVSGEAFIKNYIDENQNELYETILMNFIGEHRRSLSRKQLEQALNKIDQLEPYYITLRIYRSLCSIYKQGESITLLDDDEFQLISEKISREFNGFYPVKDVFEICRINRLTISERLMKAYNRATRDDSSWSCSDPADLYTIEPSVATPPIDFTFDPVSVRTVIPEPVTNLPTAPPTRPPTTEPTAAPTTAESTTTEEVITQKAATQEVTTKEATTKEATTKEATTKEATTKEATTEEVTTKELCLGDCVPDTETPPMTTTGGVTNGYDDEFLAQFNGVHFARTAHAHYTTTNKDENLVFFENCVYKVDTTENYVQGVSIDYTLILDNSKENSTCPISRKCSAKMEEDNINYNVACDDDMVILENNLDGGDIDSNGGKGGTNLSRFGSGSGSGSGSASSSGSGDYSGSGNNEVVPALTPGAWEGKEWKLPLLIILIVLLVCSILACLFCVVCKKNKEETQQLNEEPVQY